MKYKTIQTIHEIRMLTVQGGGTPCLCWHGVSLQRRQQASS